VAVVPLTGLEDADRVRSVIESVWGEQVLPREMVRAFQHAGSVLYGAEAPGGDLVGFVLGFAGLSEGLHVHSHMLAAVPEWQDRGVGFALKLAQRAHCLDHGIEQVRWTFDPLVARNARFNLGKLGAEAFRLLPNFYGRMTDRLNRDDRSDRFELRWRLSSERVGRALAGEAERPRIGEALVARDERGMPRPTGKPPQPGATVAVPADHHALKGRDPAAARAWRDAVEEAARRCFEAGLAAVWLDRDRGYVFDLPEAAP